MGRTEGLDPVQLIKIGAERLVGDDVRPVLQRRDGPRTPDGEVIAHRHDVRAHLLQHRLVVAVGEVVLRGELLTRGLVLLAHAHDLQVIGVLRGLVHGADVAMAKADEGDRQGGFAGGASSGGRHGGARRERPRHGAQAEGGRHRGRGWMEARHGVSSQQWGQIF